MEVDRAASVATGPIELEAETQAAGMFTESLVRVSRVQKGLGLRVSRVQKGSGKSGSFGI